MPDQDMPLGLMKTEPTSFRCAGTERRLRLRVETRSRREELRRCRDKARGEAAVHTSLHVAEGALVLVSALDYAQLRCLSRIWPPRKALGCSQQRNDRHQLLAPNQRRLRALKSINPPSCAARRRRTFSQSSDCAQVGVVGVSKHGRLGAFGTTPTQRTMPVVSGSGGGGASKRSPRLQTAGPCQPEYALR